MQPPQSPAPTPLDSLLARLLASSPNARLPPASWELYRQKLSDFPLSTVSAAIESLIDKGFKVIPHVGEITGLCKATGTQIQEHASVWEWAGYTLEGFEKLPRSTRNYWHERWDARLEAMCRANGKPVSSSRFAPEPLDDALSRLGLDSRGRIVEHDPLGLNGPAHVEDHTPPDTRPWGEIAAEARTRQAQRLDAIIASHVVAREEALIFGGAR